MATNPTHTRARAPYTPARHVWLPEGIELQIGYRERPKAGDKNPAAPFTSWQTCSPDGARTMMAANHNPHHTFDYALRVVSVRVVEEVTVHEPGSAVYDKTMTEFQRYSARMEAAGKAHMAVVEAELAKKTIEKSVEKARIQADKYRALSAKGHYFGLKKPCQCDPMELGWLGRNVFSGLHHWLNKGCVGSENWKALNDIEQALTPPAGKKTGPSATAPNSKKDTPHE